MKEYKIHNADVVLNEDSSVDDLIDVIEGNRVYIPAIYVLNKIDQVSFFIFPIFSNLWLKFFDNLFLLNLKIKISIEELEIIYKVPHCVPISAHHKWNFDDLLETLWEYLDFTRIYTKPKGQLPDYNEPVILRRDNRTVEGFVNKIHRTLMKDFKHALVWGSSVKHNPQVLKLL